MIAETECIFKVHARWSDSLGQKRMVNVAGVTKLHFFLMLMFLGALQFNKLHFPFSEFYRFNDGILVQRYRSVTPRKSLADFLSVNADNYPDKPTFRACTASVQVPIETANANSAHLFVGYLRPRRSQRYNFMLSCVYFCHVILRRGSTIIL